MNRFKLANLLIRIGPIAVKLGRCDPGPTSPPGWRLRSHRRRWQSDCSARLSAERTGHGSGSLCSVGGLPCWFSFPRFR